MFKINTKKFFWIPTEDEWYKAAYYDPTLNDGSGGYWNYATRSNDAPTPITADSVGNGSSGDSGNFANYSKTANWNGTTVGNVTSVGTNGGSSYYGTFDMSGNIHEWNDAITMDGIGRGRRGGDWEDDNALTGLSATQGRRLINNEPFRVSGDLGFRICSSIYNNNNNFVMVDDINNIADTTSFGAVNYKYKIGKYEVTNDEYVEFLNSIAKNDIYNTYDSSMTSNTRGGIIRNGTPGDYSYVVKTDMGNKPVVYVSWFSCARYCNWLTNGKSVGSQNKYTTEDGIYSLNGANTTEIILKSNTQSFKINAKTKDNSYYIPTEDEWYKAAYYDPTLNDNIGGYWSYATQSNTVPTPITANSTGDGSAGSSGNFANFNRDADWNNENGVVTSVGTNGGPSYYGTYDQSGNAYEWNDSVIDTIDPSSGFSTGPGSRGIRGGYWLNLLNIDEYRLSTTGRNSNAPALSNSGVSFRVASKNNPLSLSNFVPIGDSNNNNDITGYGRVNYAYQIGKYEITHSEYAEFLNSVAVTDTYNLYEPFMDSSRCGIIRSGQQGSFVYTIKSNWHNKPIVFISWFRAARYCNWLTNGKPVGNQDFNTTEDGTYFLNGANTTEIIIKTTTFRIHSED